MKRLILTIVLASATLLCASANDAAGKRGRTAAVAEESDRDYWAGLAYRIAAPLLSNMSRGELQKNMIPEVSPRWDGRTEKVTYMEAFGRLMAGIAPWLALPDDDTPESAMRSQLREWALKSYANAVDPESPDYLLWKGHDQALVDAAYIAESFMRAPKTFWEPLDEVTKQRYIACFQGLRCINPPYSNWLMFGATVETFLMQVGAEYDALRIYIGVRKVEEWYVGDGLYSDGPNYAQDYYNAYVIQPMYLDIIEELVARKAWRIEPGWGPRALLRMQRYAEILERFISPEGTFPAVGRSITYRMAAFQPLAQLAWRRQLPAALPGGQVRAALTAVMKRMFSVEGNFNEAGFLTLGFAGHQPGITDGYTNNGSVYLTSLVFLPLGLPADDSFWTDAPQDWTAKKAWSGAEFPKDTSLEKRR